IIKYTSVIKAGNKPSANLCPFHAVDFCAVICVKSALSIPQDGNLKLLYATIIALPRARAFRKVLKPVRSPLFHWIAKNETPQCFAKNSALASRHNIREAISFYLVTL